MEESQLHIPEGWERFKFSQVITKVRNGYSGEQVNYITIFPVTRIETISDGNVNFDKVGYVKNIPSSFQLKSGDILFSNINSIKHIGKLAFVEKDVNLYHGMNLLIFQFDNDINKKFIYYYLLTRKNWFEKVATQAINQASINQSTLNTLDLVIPKSKTEQQSIAEILSKTDQAISNTEALIAKYTRIKTGLMQDLLTKGIDESGNIRTEQTHEFKDSPLGRIPKEWECLSIKDIAERLRSGVTPKGGSDVYEKEGILLIRSQNVYSYGFKLDDVAYINEEINNRMLGSQLKEFDVLLNITGASIGRATYVQEGFPRANVNQHVCAIRLKKADVNNAIFLSSYLNSINGQNQIYQNIAGSNREGINYTQIKEINVPFFNNDFELEKFSEMVTKSNERINSEIKMLSKLQSLKTGLMQDLLSGKVRVNNLINKDANGKL